LREGSLPLRLEQQLAASARPQLLLVPSDSRVGLDGHFRFDRSCLLNPSAPATPPAKSSSSFAASRCRLACFASQSLSRSVARVVSSHIRAGRRALGAADPDPALAEHGDLRPAVALPCHRVVRRATGARGLPPGRAVCQRSRSHGEADELLAQRGGRWPLARRVGGPVGVRAPEACGHAHVRPHGAGCRAPRDSWVSQPRRRSGRLRQT
jgi:hypothetical protein